MFYWEVIIIGYYALTDGNGSFIRHDKQSGKYVSVRSSKEAEQFDSVVKAESVLKNSISKSIRSNYSVQFFYTGNEVNRDALDYNVTNGDSGTKCLEFADWNDKVSSIKDVLFLISEDHIKAISDELSKSDKMVNDIQHYIEFGNFNAYQGWRCFKALQESLRKRRKLKDEMAILSAIKSSNFPSAENLIRGLGERKYCPRVLPELFGG